MDKTKIYEERINKVMDYIEKNLDSNLCLEELSKVACFSKYHFSRIFSSYVNESLYNFINRLRVEKAAIFLINSNKSLTSIAFICGFNDSATFSRAFKKHFKISPSKWRKNRNSKIHQEDSFNRSYNIIKESDIKPIEIIIKEYPKRYISYVRRRGKYSNDYRVFKELYDELVCEVKYDISKEATIVIYHDFLGITDDKQLRISMGVEIKDNLREKGRLGVLSLERNKYLICKFKLFNDEYEKAWNIIYKKILPSKGLFPSDGYCYEKYSSNCYDFKTKLTKVDIYVPVKNGREL